MTKHALFIIPAVFIVLGCASLPESDDAADETGWELADQLLDLEDVTVAVVDIDGSGIPADLLSTYRSQITTTLAMAFRELDSENRVVTRDRVDQVMDEYRLELEGLSSSDAQSRLGQVLGADVLVSGQIILLEEDVYRGKFQLIETSTGVVLGGASWDFWFDTESDL